MRIRIKQPQKLNVELLTEENEWSYESCKSVLTKLKVKQDLPGKKKNDQAEI